MSDHCDACVWELSETPCPECVETIQKCADQDDSSWFSDWNSPEDSVYDSVEQP